VQATLMHFKIAGFAPDGYGNETLYDPGLGRVKTLRKKHGFGGLGDRAHVFWLRPHRGHQRLDAHDVHNPGEIVGEHM
jgi:hypothetical protein